MAGPPGAVTTVIVGPPFAGYNSSKQKQKSVGEMGPTFHNLQCLYMLVLVFFNLVLRRVDYWDISSMQSAPRTVRVPVSTNVLNASEFWTCSIAGKAS